VAQLVAALRKFEGDVADSARVSANPHNWSARERSGLPRASKIIDINRQLQYASLKRLGFVRNEDPDEIA